jgi:hypothetical protein
VLPRVQANGVPAANQGVLMLYSPEYVQYEFSELPHSPGSMRQGSYVEYWGCVAQHT